MDPKKIEKLLQKGLVKRAIDELLENTKNDDLHRDIVMLSSRFVKNEKDWGNDLIDDGFYRRENNKINNSILNILEDYKEEANDENQDSNSQKTASVVNKSKVKGKKNAIIQNGTFNGDLTINID